MSPSRTARREALVARLIRTLRDERGVTLIELMVATLVIVAAAGSWMISVSAMAHTATHVSRQAELWSLGHSTELAAVSAGCGLTVGTEAELNDPTVVGQALQLREELCGPPYSGSGPPQGTLGVYSFPVSGSGFSTNYLQSLTVSPVWSDPGAWGTSQTFPSICEDLVGQQPIQMAYQIYAQLNGSQMANGNPVPGSSQVVYVGSFVHSLPTAGELYHPANQTAGGVVIALTNLPSPGPARTSAILGNQWALQFQVGSNTYTVSRAADYVYGCVWFPLLTGTTQWTIGPLQVQVEAGVNTQGQEVASITNTSTGASMAGVCAEVAAGSGAVAYAYAPGASPTDCP